MARLRCVRGPSAGAQQTLGFVASLGSERGNTLVLAGDAVLSRHAEIRVMSGKYTLAQATPKAVIHVNGKPLTAPYELRNGDLIVLGPHEFLFEHQSTVATTPRQPVATLTPEVGPIEPKARLSAYNDALEALEAFRVSEKLQSHIATMYQVAALVSSTLSLETLRERLFDALDEALRPDRMFILVLDGPKPKIAAQRLKESMVLRGVTQFSQSIVSHVTQNKEAVLVEDSQEDARFNSKMSIVRQNVDSCVCAPLLRKEKIIGALYADRINLKPPFEPFHDEDMKLLGGIAALFSAAYENAGLYQQSVELGKKLSELNQAARQVCGSLDVDRVIKEVSDCARRILECESCAVLLADANGLNGSARPNDERAFRERVAVVGVDRSLSVPIPALEQDGRPAGVIRVAGRSDGRSFDEIDQKALGILALQASTSIRNASLELGRKLHDHELSIAAKIQTRLLPKRLPQLPGFDLAAHYQPKEAVGGDYYDLMPLDENRLGVVVADVCGKGVPASIIMAEMRTFLHVVAPVESDPSKLMSRLNLKLNEDLPRNMFVTAIYGIVDRRDPSFTFVCCGHNPLIVWRRDEGRVRVSPKSGTALGPMPVEQFDSSLKPMKVPLGRGDRVVLYSDGLVETMNPKEVMYEARLQEFVKNAGSVPSSEFLSGLLKDLESFRQGCEPPDDLTIVTFLVVP